MTSLKNFVASPEGQELSVLCLDYGYKLAERVQDLTRGQVNFLITALNYRVERASLESKFGAVNDEVKKKRM